MTIRERAASLGPYTALIVVLVPLLVVEPAKLFAVLIAGEGHWITGTSVLIVAYAGSLFVVERLFRLLKPHMMRARLVRRPWAGLMAARRKGLAFAPSLMSF